MTLMVSNAVLKSVFVMLRRRRAAVAAFVAAAGSALIVGAANFFEYVLRVPPCPLCLDQRKFHYVVVVLAVVAGVAALKRAPRALVVGALIAVALVLIAGAAVAIYHSGVEWKLWAGPQDCSGPIQPLGKAGSLLEQMESASVVRCDEAAWRLLGLSLAGYNAIGSVVLAAVAVWGVGQRRARRARR